LKLLIKMKLQLLQLKRKKSDGICKKRTYVLNEKSGGDDHCGLCSVAYCDNTDKKSDEQWLQCSGCTKWFHDSCAKSYGAGDDDETFTCYTACELGLYSQLSAKSFHSSDRRPILLQSA